MNGLKRELADALLDIPPIDADSCTRVIRSHRLVVPKRKFSRTICVAVVATVACSTLATSVVTVHSKPSTATASVALPTFHTVAPMQPPYGTTDPTYDPPRTTPVRASRSVERTQTISRANIVIQFALQQQGKPYVWAADGPNAYDCSGLALRAYAEIGIDLPHYTGSMLGIGTRIYDLSLLRPGDLIFPSYGHVAIYLGNGMQVAASSGQHRVVVQPVYAFYAGRRYI